MIPRYSALLDEWRLDEWLGLFTEDARYVVPATDMRDGDPRETLAIINDDLARLSARVERLKSRQAHREFPWSRTRRLITNVRVPKLWKGKFASPLTSWFIESGEVMPTLSLVAMSTRWSR